MTTFKNPVVNCDECEKEFKLKPSRIKVEVVAEKIERSYFRCPKCKHKFIIMYKDREVKENLKEMDNIKIQIQELLKNDKNVESLIEHYEKLYYRNLDISENYKSLYER